MMTSCQEPGNLTASLCDLNVCFGKGDIYLFTMPTVTCRGIARIFQRGGGGHTVSNIIVMAFSPRNIVGCFLKKGLQRGGHRHPRTPPPSLRP